MARAYRVGGFADSEFDEDDELTSFTVFVPVSNDDEELLARIKERPSLKAALIEFADCFPQFFFCHADPLLEDFTL